MMSALFDNDVIMAAILGYLTDFLNTLDIFQLKYSNDTFVMAYYHFAASFYLFLQRTN